MPEPVMQQRSPPASNNKVHKKSSAQKQKGAVRAKSGCYTCRIRRKKCDEQPDADGNCQTCVRLRLECLGFGAKRPEWMREGNSVVELRERIKTFLASQGMIKGHSGGMASSARQTDADQQVLTLSTENGSLAGSPPRIGSQSPANGFPPSHERAGSSGHGHGHFPRFAPSSTTEDDAFRRGDSLLHPRLHRTYLFTPSDVDDLFEHMSDGNDYTAASSTAASYNRSSPNFQPEQLSPDSDHRSLMSTNVMLSQYPMMNPVLMSNNLSASPWNGANANGAHGRDHNFVLSRANFPAPHHNQIHELTLPAPIHSTFGPLYHTQFDVDDAQMDDEDMTPTGASDNIVVHSPSTALVASASQQYIYNPAVPFVYHALADPAFVDRGDGRLYMHYMQHVLPAMYLLADRSIDDLIRHLADVNPTVRNAMCFAASSHWQSKKNGRGAAGGASPLSSASSGGTPPSLTMPLGLLHANSNANTNDGGDTSAYRQEVSNSLEHTKLSGTLSEGEALASLMSVSSFLFSGGRGGWMWFLDVACEYVDRLLNVSSTAAAATSSSSFGFDGSSAYIRPPSYAEVLRHSSDTVRFIVRATMWFEVLASVTEVRKPRFMEVYRELFNAARFTTVDDDVLPSATGNGTNANNDTDASASAGDTDTTASTTARGFSMLSIMGCDNRTFLAIAEISEFAAWKEEELRKGRLSVPELVMRGKQLEEQFFPRRREVPDLLDGLDMDFDPMLFGGGGVNGSSSNGINDDSHRNRRKYTARIFRAAAKLYLHTIISDDQPLCAEIEDGVHEVIKALQDSPFLENPSSEVAGSIVRSVVFPICIAGSMSDKRGEQEYLSSLLRGQSEAGNCAEVLKAMQSVWKQRRDRQTHHRRESGRAAAMVSWRDVVQQNGLLLLV